MSEADEAAACATAQVAPYLRGIAGSPVASQCSTSSTRAAGSFAFVFATCATGAATT